jgi:hypothetical protein
MARLTIAFFCSGFGALLCQIVWQRMLSARRVLPEPRPTRHLAAAAGLSRFSKARQNDKPAEGPASPIRHHFW